MKQATRTDDPRHPSSIPSVVGIIDTIAGGGDGSGTPGITQAVLPNSIVTDSDGNLFIVEQSKHRVRFVDFASGVMTTFAGGAASCGPDLGDGGAATTACLSYPFRLALDGSGNLFIADQGHGRVRRVDRVTGIITTVAGIDTQYDPGGGDGGPATSARVDPYGIAIDADGNLFIGDLRHRRLRRVDATTQTITTVVTTPIDTPFGLAFDPNGDLVVANGSRVIRVSHVTYAARDGANGVGGRVWRRVTGCPHEESNRDQDERRPTQPAE